MFFFSEKERQQSGIPDACGCLWVYLADLRASEGSSHFHYNLFYDPLKHQDAILPPAAALAPTLWPQFHLRWACPTEAQAGELEAHCRSMSRKFTELQKVMMSILECIMPDNLSLSLSLPVFLYMLFMWVLAS